MISSNNNIPVSCLWRIFFPVILFVGVILVLVSVTTTSFDDILRNLEKAQPNLQADQLSPKELNTKNSFGEMFWKNVDLMEFSIPAIVEEKAIETEINSRRINVMNVDTFYREALPPLDVEVSHQSILLLHGASFKSKTWLDLNTINLLAAMGHRVVALDLPGYGETASTLHGDKGNYLNEIIGTLKLKNVVIVSPSMSGGFSIPFLIKHSKDIDGYIPVAPVSTNEIVYEGPNITTPTLILYGELDRGLGFTSLNHLSHLPNSQPVVLPNAKHPAYLDQPQMFHRLIYNFMKQLKDHEQN